jgi:predicted HTH domain antitoxin
METVSVSGLKNNPSQALRMAHRGVALMVGIESTKVLDEKGVRPALATALFRDGHLSLARASRLAELPLGQFVSHLSRLGIPVVNGSAHDANQDMETLEQWLALS